VIIGGRTAGFTLVQTFLSLPETNEFLELATGRFERPRSPTDQNPSNGKWSNAEPLIPDLVVDNDSPRTYARGRARKSARRAPVANATESPEMEPDPVLSAAIKELTRRIDAASSRTEP
jgi:C-terminal processing protease CtpA/Prc